MDSHCFKLHRSYLVSFNLSNVGEIFWVKSKRTLEKEKENFCVVLTYSMERAREIRKFHVAVVQQRLRNVQKSVKHVKSCFFFCANINLNLLFFFLFAVEVQKLPVVVIQKFCYHGDATSHFSSLL